MSIEESVTPSLSRAEINAKIIMVLHEMVQDWDLDFTEDIGPDTRIIEDLEFESIDLIQLMVAIEKAFGVKGLPYEKIFMTDGAYINELNTAQLADFIHENLMSSQKAES